MRPQRKPPPGSRWRVLAHSPRGAQDFEMRNQGVFDEIVVDDWFHLERMDTRKWWMQVGETHFWISINRAGGVSVAVTEGAARLYGFGESTQNKTKEGHR